MVVPVGGLEPPRPKLTDFESDFIEDIIKYKRYNKLLF